MVAIQFHVGVQLDMHEISKHSAVLLLQSLIPDCEWLLKQIESENGWLRFPPTLTTIIANLKLENYPLIYENENAIAYAFLRSFLLDAEIQELNAELESASIDERGEFLLELTSGIDAGFSEARWAVTEKEKAEQQKVIDSWDPEERAQNVRKAQFMFISFFASFYQSLSMMVHGEKLTSLVAQAKTGNDDAFVKAIQIDKRILNSIPYFTERYARAQDQGDSNFFDRLSYRLKSAPYIGKIRFKSLWLSFSILDQAGLLRTLPHSEILDICDDAGVGGFKNRIEDVKNLRKRLSDYYRFQKRGVIATL